METIDNDIIHNTNIVKARFETVLMDENSDSPPADPSDLSFAPAHPPPNPTPNRINSLRKASQSTAGPASRHSSVHTTRRNPMGNTATKRPLPSRNNNNNNACSGNTKNALDSMASTANAYGNITMGSIIPQSTNKQNQDMLDETSSLEVGSDPEKNFDASAYDSDLVALIQNGILQQGANSVMWKDVAGLEHIKNLLSEAIVLPMEYPDLFKVLIIKI